MPNPQYFSKLRTFLGGQGRRKIGLTSKAHHRQVDSPSVFSLETLEPRVMLAADLAGAVQAAQVLVSDRLVTV